MSLLCHVEVNSMQVSVIPMCEIIFIFKVISKIFSRNIKLSHEPNAGTWLANLLRAQIWGPHRKSFIDDNQQSVRTQREALTMNGMGIIKRAIHPNTVLAHLNVNALYVCVVKRGKMVPPRLPVKDVVTERY